LARLRALARDGENPEGFEELVAHVGGKPANVDAATRRAFSDLYQPLRPLAEASRLTCAHPMHDPHAFYLDPEGLELDRD